MVCRINPSVSIGLIMFFLKYSVVFIPQKSCISLRLLAVEQYSSSADSFSLSNLTCVVTCGLTCVVTCGLTVVEVGPTVAVATLVSGIVMRNTSPSTNCGSPPEYILVYLYVFLIPEPSSSARPISRNTFEIGGFFWNGSNVAR